MRTKIQKYVNSALDSGIFSIKEIGNDSFSILNSDGNVFDDGYSSYAAAFNALVASAYIPEPGEKIDECQLLMAKSS